MRQKTQTKQLEFGFDPAAMIGELPPILTLEEFFDELEREYGETTQSRAVRAAL